MLTTKIHTDKINVQFKIPIDEVSFLLDTILVTAYSKAPQGSAMYERFKHAGLVMEIDKETHRIVDVEFTFITSLASSYFSKLLVGSNFYDELDEIIERIKKNFIAPSQQSVIVALKNAHQRYCDEIEK
ncbi:hypothetical protein CSV67_11920 [Sporosarcina sp. P2]|uniref:DUF3870 domain-containing protein n=1 Tax=Sporosarcina sp. P2 TaxID=2048251 RepID=UPI000C16E9B3|nr:DUF3870 domain-containing protein [Sporosarcina sp. P2]PID01776.1 hypothetical protein CSV67_11920 [Sporosarcina sp. P2]